RTTSMNIAAPSAPPPFGLGPSSPALRERSLTPLSRSAGEGADPRILVRGEAGGGSAGSAVDFEPLAVYIHWPFCRSKCPYCDFNSHVRQSVDAARWTRALLCDLDHQASLAP